MDKFKSRLDVGTIRAVANWLYHNSNDECYIDAASAERLLNTMANDITNGKKTDLEDY